MNNKDVNYKNLNEVISLSKKLLKIVYIMIIVVAIYVSTILIKEWGILNTVKTIFGLLTPLFIGLIFAWLFKPVVNYLETKKVRRWISIVAIYILILLILYLLLSTIIPMLYEQVTELAKVLPSIFNDLKTSVSNFVDKLGGSIGLDFATAKDNMFIKVEEWSTTVVKV